MATATLDSNGVDRGSRRFSITFGLALLIGLPLFGYLVFQTEKTLLIAGIGGLILMAFSLVKPEAATLFVVFVLYSNLAVVAKTFHGIPDFLAGSFSLLLCLPLANYIFIKRQKLVVDYVFLLMVLLLAVVIASSFVAKDTVLAFEWVVNYIIEAMAIYFLFINVVRTQAVLKKVVWALLIVGVILGSMSLYQELFNDYRNTFGGLAQRNRDIEFEDEFYGDVYGEGKGLFQTRDDVGGKNRAGGPIGKANRYAQIMMVLLPLALFRYWNEKKRRLRYFAAFSGVLILCGILLTYSRGAFLTMCFMVFLLFMFKYVRFYQILVSVVVVVVLMFAAAPGYLSRIESIQGVEGLFDKSAEVRPDGTTRGRLTEMLAAFICFLDHPVLGVGPANYTPYYSNEYQNDPDIAFRFLGRQRRAHILYFELAAETGILGIGLFMAIAILVMYRLWTVRRQTIGKYPDFASLVTSLWFGIFAYLGTAIFLHLSYQRFYWFALALGGAAIQIYQNEIQPKLGSESAEPRNRKTVPSNGRPMELTENGARL